MIKSLVVSMLCFSGFLCAQNLDYEREELTKILNESYQTAQLCKFLGDEELFLESVKRIHILQSMLPQEDRAEWQRITLWLLDDYNYKWHPEGVDYKD